MRVSGDPGGQVQGGTEVAICFPHDPPHVDARAKAGEHRLGLDRVAKSNRTPDHVVWLVGDDQ
jgi:hypothetical protein